MLEQLGIDVLQVRQQALVELLERTRTDLLAKEMVGRHNNVVTRTARQQLAFQGLVGVEHVVARLDSGGLLEIRQGGLADIVGPVVHMHHRLRLGNANQAKGRHGARQGLTQKSIHR